MYFLFWIVWILHQIFHFFVHFCFGLSFRTYFGIGLLLWIFASKTILSFLFGLLVWNSSGLVNFGFILRSFLVHHRNFFLLFKCCYFFLILNFGLMVYMDSGLSLCPKFLLIEFRIDEWLKSSRFSIEHTKSVFLLSFSIPAGLWIFSCSCLFGCSKMLRIEESGQMRIRCRKRNNNRKLRRGVSSGTTGTSLVEKGTKHKFADWNSILLNNIVIDEQIRIKFIKRFLELYKPKSNIHVDTISKFFFESGSKSRAECQAKIPRLSNTFNSRFEPNSKLRMIWN